MNKYKVWIKDTSIEEIIKADTPLEARVTFGKKHKLNYQLYANRILVKFISK